MEFKEWKQYFLQNQDHFAGVNFEEYDELTEEDKSAISSSPQQFQKGESSEGKHLFAFAKQFPDPEYLNCIKLFIREEQRHASVLGSFMHKHKIPLIKGHWVDEVFRWLRKLGGIQNTVRILLTAEIIAKVYYRALYNETGSGLLKGICLQILSDEEKHIEFQCDMLKIFHERQSFISKFLIRNWQLLLMTGTTLVVWWYHKKVLNRGGYYFGKFFFETLLIFFEAEQNIRSRRSFFKEREIIAA
jgi:hypothetical protein